MTRKFNHVRRDENVVEKDMRFLCKGSVGNNHFGTDQFGKCPMRSKQTIGQVRRYINELKKNARISLNPFTFFLIGLLQNSILSKHIPFLLIINIHSF